MKIVLKFLENSIIINDSHVFSVEVENRSYFYRIVSKFNELSKGNIDEEILFCDEVNKEINMCNKVKIVIDYFNIDLASKKVLSSLNDIICNSIDEDDISKINKLYDNITKIIIKNCQDIDLPITLNQEYSINNIVKNSAIGIAGNDDIFSNLLLLIDEMKITSDNKLLVFINLKQYLSNEELIELYKYTIYNGINILLLDSQSYGTTLNYESKLIVDNDLEEYMIL